MENASVATPVRRGRPPKELNTGDMEVGQRPSIVLPDDGFIVRENEEIAAIDSPLDDDYFTALAFMEEPVTIRLERSQEKFAPLVVDVYVNGVPQWIKVGVPQTIKRKYVEVLARAKPDAVQTRVLDEESENPRNVIDRYTSAKHPFSVIRDDNPRGAEWLTRILAEG